MSRPRVPPGRGWPAALPAAGGLVALLAMGAAGPVAAQTADRVADLGGLFEGAEEATFVLLDLETGRTVRHDPARAAERFPPASTFKIPNTLIALETGAVGGPGHAIAWDSLAVPRERFFPSSWARDQTLGTAFRNSVYWYYQALARRIGPEAYREWLARFDYGNQSLGGGMDSFWLEGDLAISADEQVEFLRRLWRGELGVSERSTRIAKDLMLLEEAPGYRLRGKTGTAEVTPTRELGWIVGVVETPEGDFAYALNMEGEDVWETWPPGRREELVVAILERLGVAGIVLAAVPVAAGSLHAQPPPTCEEVEGFHRLDFWVGQWDVYVGDRKVGTNRIEKILDGCAIVEHWTGAGGSAGKSLFYYNAATDEWKQVWVTSNATRVAGLKEKTLIERFEDGGVRFQGRIPLPDGTEAIDRTTLTPLPDGTVRQLIEASMDGETWRTNFDAIYRPEGR